ncbi:Alkaline phosphatase [Lunatimonas lonarensis]|uniref:Alkaline phosphatase n=1 Tax=Lunatimonas lonarensis TaxID=1232681 RepID=R7ZY88_9BACT|nr:alkaline phosphatase [Lunatimonas lonarensis]EON79047.1 Alkaline phosphatase [Lunatimonas lonarensis]
MLQVIKSCIFILLYFFVHVVCVAQQETKIHSHNDYIRHAPFWEAYANGLASIEADVLLLDGELYVAHELASVKPERTLKSLYLDPIRSAYSLNIQNRKPFQLLIDIKTEAYSTMKKIVEQLDQYPELFGIDGGEAMVTAVISGSRPKKEDYRNYPDHIFFDYQSITDKEDLPLEKIALFSLSFRNFSDWNGKGRLIDEHEEKLRNAIAVAHAHGKPFRFWASPDSKTAWKALKELGVDYINTDMPYQASEYLATLSDRLYVSPNVREIYKPTYESDGIQAPVKNVILLIGDGFGLAQFAAALYANNNQLSLATLRNLGLIRTQSLDDFTTDSAAAGTALASGQKVKNRSIGALPDGSPAKNLPQHLQKFQFQTGIVTTDNLTGATPGAFFAHTTERDMIKEIAGDLAKSPLNLFIGGGKNDFIRYGNPELDNLRQAGFELVSGLSELEAYRGNRVGYFASNHSLPKVAQGRKSFLKNAVSASLTYFTQKELPFFLMIEGAYIDSGGHSNHVETVVEEGIDFDEAVAEALRFADENGETLVIVTADHETGGITIPQGNVETGMVELEFSTQDHTGILVPVFAYGPHADKFRGVYENTDIFHKILEIVEMYFGEK